VGELRRTSLVDGGRLTAREFVGRQDPGDAHAQELASRAISIVTEGRRATYGAPEDNFEDIARLWTVIFRKEITAEDVALAMIVMKVARMMKTPDHEDSVVDIIGYALCLARVTFKRKSDAEGKSGS